MGLETVSTIKMFSDLIQSLAANVSKLKGTPKQRLGKSLISLLSILNDAQNSISDVLEMLDKIKTPKSGSKSRRVVLPKGVVTSVQITKTLDSSKGIENAYHALEKWARKNEKLSRALELIHPISPKVLQVIILEDSLLFNQDSIATDSDLYLRLKALIVNPDRTSFNGIKKDLRGIDRQIELLKTELRKLAKEELTIEDLF